MRISRLKVENFRAIVDTELSLGELTALIGANNAGKTTLLLALERFFGDKAGSMKPEDFNDRKKPITITVTFEGVGGEDEGQMSREWGCEATPDPSRSGKYKARVTAPRYTREDNIELDPKKFLQKYVNVIYVPAEHETGGDAEDKKDSPLEQIINDTIRRIAENDRVEKRRQRTFQNRYNMKLAEVGASLNAKLCGENGYAPNAEVRLGFREPAVTLKTDLSIIDGISGDSIDHKYMGHGTKRAFYMAALEVGGEMAKKAERDRGENAPGVGAMTSKGAEDDGRMLTLIIIDEPELHQHPQRQRLLLHALQNLSDTTHQVVYTTHSQMMITLRGAMEIRKVVNSGSGVDVYAWNNPKNRSIGGRMIKVMEEAVFASGAILVEGYTDEAIINIILHKAKHGKQPIMDTLVKKEVVVVNCDGKTSINHFYGVLESFGIKQFVVWDGDLGKTGTDLKVAKNRNKTIVDKIGIKQEFLKELESKKDTYAEGSSCVCFGLDGPAYWAKYFDTSKKELEDIIKGGERIEPKFNTAEFKNSDFYETVQNIRKYFDD